MRASHRQAQESKAVPWPLFADYRRATGPGRRTIAMLRYKLRTLLILLAVLPPLLWIGWGKYEAWRAEQERQRQILIDLPK